MPPPTMRRGRRHRRAGFTLVELLVGLVIIGVVGVSMLRLMLSQNRFYDRQSQQRGARSVARASINYLQSEARMVETAGGVVGADAHEVSLRVPYALGLICGSAGAGGATVVSLLPVDSSMFAGAAPAGTAWRANDGSYTYIDTPPVITNAGASICASAGIVTLPGAGTITVSPELTGAEPGAPMFLYQRVTYAFAPSVLAPGAGRMGLWRTVETTGASEELTAPLGAASHFRFYRVGRDTSDVTVPPLDEIRGLELLLEGESLRPGQGRAAPEQASLRTGVFFANVTP